MLIKLYFPTINTSNLNFDSDLQISREEYSRMVNDHIMENRGMVESYLNGDINVSNSPYRAQTTHNSINNCDDYGEITANIVDYNKQETNEEYFQNLSNSQKMTMLTISCDPNSEDYDAITELQYWVGDSRLINQDDTLDNRGKMASLPTRDLKIKTNDGNEYFLSNCKVLEEISDKIEPIKFIIICKIEK